MDPFGFPHWFSGLFKPFAPRLSISYQSTLPGLGGGFSENSHPKGGWLRAPFQAFGPETQRSPVAHHSSRPAIFPLNQRKTVSLATRGNGLIHGKRKSLLVEIHPPLSFGGCVGLALEAVQRSGLALQQGNPEIRSAVCSCDSDLFLGMPGVSF